MGAAPGDRWFLGEGMRRTGPVHLEQLIELLLGAVDPRGTLVWHKGFGSWTRAEDVPLVERRLTPALARAAAVQATSGGGSSALVLAQTASIDDGKPGGPLLVYGSLGLGVIAMALLGWLFWPRAVKQEAPPVIILPAPSPTALTVPVSPPHILPDATRSPVPTRPTSVVQDREDELPPAEVRKLRGVAAWSGETLALTVDNPTAWRVTEIRVRVSRLVGDDVVQDAGPLVLLPPPRPVAPGVTDLLDRVAPDRKRPGLNPLDTGSFEAKAGPCPEGFRWEIESARGYAPR